MDSGRLSRGWCLALLVALGGCAAFVGCGNGSPASPSLVANGPVAAGDGGTTTTTAAPTNVLRLTHTQWENSTRDLLRLATALGLSDSFVKDPAPPKDQFGVDLSQLVVSDALALDYRNAASTYATFVTDATDPTYPAKLNAILPASAQTTDTPDVRLNAFLTDFLPRAYRRPVTAAEIAQIAQLASANTTAESTATNDDPFADRVKWAITIILQSPYFIYRVEVGAGTANSAGRYRLDPYQTAEKLAYGLWDTMPDDDLTALAAQNKLSAVSDIAAQAKKMLADPRAADRLADFHDQLFIVPTYQGVTKLLQDFPLYYGAFGADATEDSRRTIKDLVIDNPGGVKALFTSNEVWIDNALAGLYGIDPASVPGVTDNPLNFYKTTLPSNRVGLLSHVGWLAFYSHTVDPASILRGVWAARHLLCIQLGSPPAGAQSHPIDTAQGSTNRDRVSLVTSPCGDACHKPTINPLGFSFEEFDGLGVFRTTDNGSPIDSTGSIPILGNFADEVSMMNDAVTKPQTHACYVAHWNAYLNGTPQVVDPPAWITPIAAKSMAGASTRDIIVEIVQQDAFLTVARN